MSTATRTDACDHGFARWTGRYVIQTPEVMEVRAGAHVNLERDSELDSAAVVADHLCTTVHRYVVAFRSARGG